MSREKLTPAQWRDLGTLGQYILFLHVCEKLQQREESLDRAYALIEKYQNDREQKQ